MFSKMKKHPLAVGSDGSLNFVMLEGKVNEKSKAEDHESVYNVKLTTRLGFNLTVGYSRHKDPEGITHAWVAFGDHCTEPLPGRGHTHGPRQQIRWLPFSARMQRGGMGMAC